MKNRGQGVLTLGRITIEAAAAMFITAALLDFGVGLTRVGHWLQALQIVPAALALSLSTLVFWLGVTLIFGRIYCSTVCPLGALIDLVARFRGRRAYHFGRLQPGVRSLVLGLFLLLMLGLPRLAGWIEPSGLYASLVSRLASPRLSLSMLFSLIVLAALALSALRHGRWVCTHICPVGTLLGAVATRSALRIDIDTDRCIQCRRCEHACKAECIDMESHVVDMSRCVVCFNCLPVCPADAISYSPWRHTLSLPMMQSLKPSHSCNNTSTFSPTSSPTEPSKPTAPAPAPSPCSADSSASISAKDFPCSPPKSSI